MAAGGRYPTWFDTRTSAVLLESYPDAVGRFRFPPPEWQALQPGLPGNADPRLWEIGHDLLAWRGRATSADGSDHNWAVWGLAVIEQLALPASLNTTVTIDPGASVAPLDASDLSGDVLSLGVVDQSFRGDAPIERHGFPSVVGLTQMILRLAKVRALHE